VAVGYASVRDWSTHVDFHSRLFIFKVANLCNINCSYCYMYNLGDQSFKRRPPTMSKEIAQAALWRIRDYCLDNDLREILITFHGGEPLLVKRAWYRWFLDQVKTIFADRIKAEFALQTNGTLLDDAWIDFLAANRIPFGISVDGPADVHDAFRVDHKGRGTYNKTEAAIRRCVQHRDLGDAWGVLAVANPDYSSVRIFEHLCKLGVRKFDFLFPDYNHDSPPPWSADRLARFYIELFNSWYDNNDPGIKVRFFESVIDAMLGRPTGIDALGVHPVSEIVVETDGGLEPLDVLRTCSDGYTNQNLNVLTNDITDLRGTDLFKVGLFNQDHLPDVCLDCPAYEICGGGYLPHRFSKDATFKNPSIHCQSLIEIFHHVHDRISNDLARAAAL
jgi:uncharacterized protein